MYHRTLKLMALAAFAAWVVAACSTTPTGPVPARATTPVLERVLKVGILGPFTGPAARTGDEFRGAVEMAFESVNYKVGGYKIQPVWIDSQSDPEKATRAYEEAIVGQGIQAGLLNWHSSEAVAVMEVTAKHKIPHFFGFGATDVLKKAMLRRMLDFSEHRRM